MTNENEVRGEIKATGSKDGVRNGCTWQFTDHVCGQCFGRVLECVQISDGHIFRCADCGVQGVGSPESICACTSNLRDGRRTGLVCASNKSKSRANLDREVVAEFVGVRKRS